MDAFIFDYVRTGRGRASDKGALAQKRPIDLVSRLLVALTERGAPVDRVEELLLGCSTQSGEQGSNLAKIAAVYAGWPHSVPGATISRFCNSSLDALGLVASRVHAGGVSLAVAGGVEMLSRAPMFSDRGPWFSDPDVRKKTGFVHMGVSADVLAHSAGIERPDLDAYAAESHRRAERARDWWSRSMIAIDGFADDELIRPRVDADKLAALPPLFAERDAETVAALEGFGLASAEVEARHSIASSPGLADAAALLVVGGKDGESAIGRKPKARILAYATHSVSPIELSGNPDVTKKALGMAGLEPGDVDFYEVNESFAAVPIHFGRVLAIDPERLNVSGGAIAKGHPLGATGAILAGTAIEILEQHDATVAVASICGGAGVASALVLERI